MYLHGVAGMKLDFWKILNFRISRRLFLDFAVIVFGVFENFEFSVKFWISMRLFLDFAVIVIGFSPLHCTVCHHVCSQ